MVVRSSCNVLIAVALLFLGASQSEAQSCSAAEQSAIVANNNRILQGGFPDLPSMMRATTGLNAWLSPACRALLAQSYPQPQPQPPNYPPPDYYNGGQGNVVIPGVGGCKSTGCVVP